MFRDFYGHMVLALVANLLMLIVAIFGAAWLIQVFFDSMGGV